MGMGFAATWLRQVSPLLHKTTLTTALKGGTAAAGPAVPAAPPMVTLRRHHK